MFSSMPPNSDTDLPEAELCTSNSAHLFSINLYRKYNIIFIFNKIHGNSG